MRSRCDRHPRGACFAGGAFEALPLTVGDPEAGFANYSERLRNLKVLKFALRKIHPGETKLASPVRSLNATVIVRLITVEYVRTLFNERKKNRPAHRGPVVAEQRQTANLLANLAFAPFCGHVPLTRTTYR